MLKENLIRMGNATRKKGTKTRSGRQFIDAASLKDLILIDGVNE